MTQDVQYIVQRFPTYKEKILSAYETDDEFRMLCEDFYSSAVTLKQIKSKVIKDKKNDLEYQKLFLDLESEILEFLGAYDRQ